MTALSAFVAVTILQPDERSTVSPIAVGRDHHLCRAYDHNRILLYPFLPWLSHASTQIHTLLRSVILLSVRLSLLLICILLLNFSLSNSPLCLLLCLSLIFAPHLHSSQLYHPKPPHLSTSFQPHFPYASLLSANQTSLPQCCTHPGHCPCPSPL